MSVEVGIRELRDHLSRWLEKVKAGEEVIVTERGRPIARLASTELPSQYQRLIDAGIIKPGKRRKGPLPPPVRTKQQFSLSDEVIRQRREGSVIVYVDTSALVKLVKSEDGSDTAAEIWGRADARMASALAYPEARAALAASARTGHFVAGEHRRALAQLNRFWEVLDEIDLTDGLARRAGDVAERFRLRGGDAVHLASALLLNSEDLHLATWDRELARAAAEAGVQVAPTG